MKDITMSWKGRVFEKAIVVIFIPMTADWVCGPGRGVIVSMLSVLGGPFPLDEPQISSRLQTEREPLRAELVQLRAELKAITGIREPLEAFLCEHARVAATQRSAQVETRVRFSISARRVDEQEGAREYPPD
jgi:hypothetical protein